MKQQNQTVTYSWVLWALTNISQNVKMFYLFQIIKSAFLNIFLHLTMKCVNLNVQRLTVTSSLIIVFLYQIPLITTGSAPSDRAHSRSLSWWCN